MGSMVGIPSAGVDKRLVRRRHVRFWGSPDMADYPPRLVCDANDPEQTLGVRCEMSCLAGPH
jgi:murein endopeptidase